MGKKRERIAKASRHERRRQVTEALNHRDESNQVLAELDDVAEAMLRFEGKSLNKIDGHGGEYEDDRAEHVKAVAAAIGRGYLDHPAVTAWLEEMRTFGERKILRKWRNRRLEAGVKRPMRKDDFWIATEVIHLASKGLRPTKIRQELINKLRLRGQDIESFCGLTETDRARLAARLKKMSRQGFHRLLKRLNVIDPPYS